MKGIMASIQRCSKCGEEILSAGSTTLCTSCLLTLGLEAGNSDAPATVLSHAVARHGAAEIEPSNDFLNGPRRFGDYELIEEIARGGMGVVYKARQISLDRLVAIKMLLLGPLARPEFIKRFRLEAAAAGGLDHPNIVGVHEVGIHEGQHFLVMDYVDGPNLAKLISGQPLSTPRAAGYLKTIAGAVEFAHQRGILHRDLKPSNILIGSDDQPRVADFGLAKRLEGDVDLTVTGQVLGSPNYMPPEQAAGQRGNLTRTADVYSLGAILYQMLTGRPPFQADSIATTLELVKNAEPLSPRLLHASVPRDLETICLKCLEKEPAKRYSTAQELAEELGRYLINEPIHARPVTTAERAWRWCRRKPLLAALSAVTTVLLLAVAIGSPIAAFRIAAAHKIVRQNLYAANIKALHQAWEDGNARLALDLLEAQRPAHGQEDEDLRGFEWRYLWKVCQGEQAFTFEGHTEAVASVAFTPGGKTIASASRRGTVKLWDLSSQREIVTLRKNWSPPVVFSMDGGLLASNSDQDYGLTLWQIKSAKEITMLWSETDVWKFYLGVDALAFSPDGKRLATAAALVAVGSLSQVTVLDVATRQRGTILTDLPQKIFALAFSPDGRTLAAGGALGLFKVWDMATERALAAPSLEKRIEIRSIAFSPNGKLIAIPQGKSVTLFGLDTRTTFGSFTTEKSEETSHVAFSPDGQWLAVGTTSGVVELVDPKNQRRLRRFIGHTEAVSSLAFSPDSQALLSGSLDKTVRLWDILEKPEPESLQGHTHSVSSVAISSDTRTIASGSVDGMIKLWDAVSLQELATLPGHSYQVRSLAFEPEGSRLVSASGIEADQGSPLEPGDVKVWDLSKRAEIAMLEGFTNCARSVAFSPGAGSFAVAAPYAAELWDVSSLRPVDMTSGQQRTTDERVTAVAFSPNGGTLAVGSHAKTIELWNVTARKPRGELSGSSEGVECLAFSPNGELLASGGRDSLVRLWDVRARKLIRSLPGHKALTVSSVAFSPDGKTLASGGGDGTVRLWSVASQQELLTLRSDADKVMAVAFSADGKILLAGNGDGVVRLWRAPSPDEIKPPRN